MAPERRREKNFLNVDLELTFRIEIEPLVRELARESIGTLVELAADLVFTVYRPAD